MSDSTYIRTSASKAIADALEIHPDSVVDTLEAIYGIYKQKVT